MLNASNDIPTLTLEIQNTWATGIAKLMAQARFGPGVSMNGKHNPLPSEIKAAKEFLEYEVYPVICIKDT